MKHLFRPFRPQIVKEEKVNEEEYKSIVHPVVVSASRSTDIPAFYSKWFINRLKAGYSVWVNPFNQKRQLVKFDKTRLVVFWSKNPKPLIRILPEIDKLEINYYFQFTLNDYEAEGLEPNVPDLADRINTFRELSNRIGKGKVIWRFDPMILTKDLSISGLIKKVKKIGDMLHNYTNKLVFSFADIAAYRKVQINLRKAKIEYLDFDEEKMKELASELSMLNKGWDLELATCAESVSLEEFGIKHNKCIDDDLIAELFSNDKQLMEFIGRDQNTLSLFSEKTQKKKGLKDKGQRKLCGCINSKDIGQYNTCKHLCVYCYANNSANVVHKNSSRHHEVGESII